MSTTLRRIQYREELIFIPLKLLQKVPKQITFNLLFMLRANMTTNLNQTLERKYSKHWSISSIRRTTLIYQYTVSLIELEIMLLQKKISKKVLKSTLMSNLDLKKKTFMKREHNQHIYKKQIIISIIVNLQRIPLMKLMRLTKKWERHVQTLCSKEKQTKRKAIYRTFR
jgi:hypothetical protein